MSVNRAAAIRAKMKEIVPEYSNGVDSLPEDAGILDAPEVTAGPQFSSPRWNSANPTRYPTPRI